MPRLQDCLPFKLKKLEQAAGAPPAPEEQKELVECHDALETQEWTNDGAPHRGRAAPAAVMNPVDAVAEAVGKARKITSFK